MSQITVAAAQAAPHFLDLDASLDKACQLIAEAGRQGVQLLVFPETWLPGYPFWTDTIPDGARWNHPPARAAYARLYANSVEVPSATTDRLAAAAQEASLVVAIGLNERLGRTLYNSLLYLSDQGQILGVHRKLMPTYGERLVWGLGDGSTMEVYDTTVGRVGGMICWEHWMPLLRFHMHSQGEEIHAAVWPTVNERHQIASRSYAFEGRTFVIAVGSILCAEDLPLNLALFAEWTPPEHGYVLRGGSAIIGPDGNYVVEPVYNEERLIVADIDLGRIPEELLTLDVCGHYHRPDIFKLQVNTLQRISN